MKSQHDNPVFAALGSQLLLTRCYPAEHCNIFWNTDVRNRVIDVEVVFIPRGGHIGIEGDGLDLWKTYADYTSRWTADLGNSCEGWLEPDGLTPAQVFGHLLRLGFADQESMIDALQEFSSIEESDWARDILSAFVDEEEL